MSGPRKHRDSPQVFYLHVKHRGYTKCDTVILAPRIHTHTQLVTLTLTSPIIRCRLGCHSAQMSEFKAFALLPNFLQFSEGATAPYTNIQKP
jgi:hypothetical protein